LLAYHDIPHDLHLILESYRGLRPSIPTYIPKIVAELIIKCWDAQPETRPTSKEVCDTLNMWSNSKEFISQMNRS
ncbi:14795_t:CDS:1, partial [Racocetra fulgida]